MRIFTMILAASVLGLIAPAQAQTPSTAPRNICLDLNTGEYKGRPPCSGSAAEIVGPTVLTQVNCASQFYPVLSARMHEEGSVTLTFTISTTGEVSNFKITESSGIPRLDDASLRCAQARKYTPAMRDGVAIEISWQITTSWKLQ